MANDLDPLLQQLKKNDDDLAATRLRGNTSAEKASTLADGVSYSAVDPIDGRPYVYRKVTPTSKPASITHPAWQEICYEFVQTAENATLVWDTPSIYGYIEWNVEKDATGGGQGYTGGLIGFTSKSGSMLSLIKRHAALYPNGVMSSWLPKVQQAYDDAKTTGNSLNAQTILGQPFVDAWTAAATDKDWQASQRSLRDEKYWQPALARAIADGVGPLGLLTLYDIAINHGADNGVNSMGGIANAAAIIAPPPSRGGSEYNYISALIDKRMARIRVMYTTTTADTTGRVAALRHLLDNHFSMDLANGPIDWPMYGSTFTISQWPASLPDRVQVVPPAVVQPLPAVGSTTRLGMWAPGFPDVATVQAHEKTTGLGYSIVSAFRGASGGDWLHDDIIVGAAHAGYTVLVDWNMSGDGTATWSWASWTSGSHDSYLSTLATAAKAAGRSDTVVYVRPWSEFNTDFASSRVGSAAGGTVAEFLAAWKYVVNYFKNAGVTNIRWVWCPTTDTYTGCTDVAALWPGSTYVDVIGLDGYNWGTGGSSTWASFEDIYKVQYSRVAALDPQLPIWICEVGSKEPTTSDGAAIDTARTKAAWVADAYDAIARRFPRIRAVCWFSEQKERDWRVNSTASALKALVTSSGAAVIPPAATSSGTASTFDFTTLVTN